jgi:hypothetical protein
MTLKAVGKLFTISAMAALSGCQSAPHSWAFWKHDSAPDASAVARTAEPTLPSAQSKPQPVAIAGLTPAAPPSSANLAAAKAPGMTSPVAGTPAFPPSMSIPVTSSATLGGAPPTAYPNAANSLADRLTSAPNAATKASTTAVSTSSLPPLPPTSPLVAASSPPAAGPYDPKAYKPNTALASAGADGTGDAGEVDRYGLGTASRYSASTPPSMPQSTASLPTNNYSAAPGAMSPRATATAPAPAYAAAPAPNSQLPAQSPAPIADRYGMSSTLPSSASMNPTTPASPATVAPTATPSYASAAPATPITTPVAIPTPAVRTTASVGTYRPGGTSSYSSSTPTAPIEVASRPAAPLSTTPPITPIGAPGAGSEPWTPPAPSALSPATRTY